MSKYNWQKKRKPRYDFGWGYQDDFCISHNGDIRYSGDGTTTYTIDEFHSWLIERAEELEQQAQRPLLVPSERSTDNIITLNYPFNIDEHTARYLVDGSVVQEDAVYSSVQTLGEV
jgi:hypothetical protein